MFEHTNVQNGTSLRDVFIFWTWQHPKRSNSARLPHFSRCTPSKTKNSARRPSKMESWVQSWQTRTNAFCDFFSPPVSREHVFCTPPATEMHLCRSSSNVLCLPSFLEILQNPHVLVTFDKVHNPLRLPRETTSELPKMVRTWCVLYILTWKCASRHNGVHFFNIWIWTSKSGPRMVCFYILASACASRRNCVHFFDIWTSKSGPRMVCFVHFDLEMCFAPQRCALFQHLNFQKWSENGVLCTFWLGNVLRATTACTFSTSELPKVVREWCVLYILTCKCASRHNGLQFFISHLASWLRTRRFSEPTFRPSGAPNHWKNIVFCDFATCSRICIFFLLIYSFSSTFLSSHLSLLSASSLLCFSSVHIVGSLTSKLPSIILIKIVY